VTAAPASFYDQAYSDGESTALVHWLESPLKRLYIEARFWISNKSPVIDLGCGPGQFAQCLAGRRHEAGYLGLDFSARAIEVGRKLAGPGQSFAKTDLRKWTPRENYDRKAVFVCLETLEHLDDDLGLVSKIPSARRFIFSVPNFDAESHVRTFGHPKEIWERYDSLLIFRRWSAITLPTRAIIHVLDTLRRSDSSD
jgi:SAM-dependent methyltransferase